MFTLGYLYALHSHAIACQSRQLDWETMDAMLVTETEDRHIVFTRMN
jgi:hypothetical protein